jgi:Skp family chaperone for outer membrane proteins
MILHTLLSAGLLLGSGSALAQTADPTAQPLGGPVIPGVCLLSREAIFANAAVGKAATARLQELARAAQAEVDAERTPLETEAKAIQALPDNAQTKARREAFAVKWQALQAKAQHNSREIEATRVKALGRIANDAQPVIAQVYTQKKCGLLFDRNSALGGNFTNDLTADVVKTLDTKVQTITFERERLPQQPAAPAKN